VLDALGFHTDPDFQTELDTLNVEIATLMQQVAEDKFRYPEDRMNAHSALDNLQRRARALEPKAAEQNQRLDWIASCVRLVGDAELAGIAYVVFGTSVLPC
jgi:hypothetical protein